MSLEATLSDDGTIIFQGAPYTSSSAAAGEARKTVLGGGDRPATNGWTFWQFADKDGTTHTLEDARQEVRKRRNA